MGVKLLCIKLLKSCTITYRKLRKKLLDTDILKDTGEFYEFVVDYIFASPSAASNMILGRNSNGIQNEF